MVNETQKGKAESQSISTASLEIQRQLQEVIGNRSRLWSEFDQAKGCSQRLGQISPYPDHPQIESQRQLNPGQSPLSELSLVEGTIELEQSKIIRLEKTIEEHKAHIAKIQSGTFALILLGVSIVAGIGLWYVGYFVQVLLVVIVLFFVFAGKKK